MQWDLKVHDMLCFLGGKSAIMTGIVVALGGRATQTSRGLSLKNFVKKGCRWVHGSQSKDLKMKKKRMIQLKPVCKNQWFSASRIFLLFNTAKFQTLFCQG